MMELKFIIEAALFAAQRPLSLSDIENLFAEEEKPEVEAIKSALAGLKDDFKERPLELKEVASGFRFQVKESLSPWISRLFEEKPVRYSKALLETLAIIAYRQPTTRGEIEDIRGVAVSTMMIKTLLEREWIQVVGHKEVPGRPSLYATTRGFLDYFNLVSLNDLPPLHTFIDKALESVEAVQEADPNPTESIDVEPETPPEQTSSD